MPQEQMQELSCRAEQGMHAVEGVYMSMCMFGQGSVEGHREGRPHEWVQAAESGSSPFPSFTGTQLQTAWRSGEHPQTCVPCHKGKGG